ncbi:MAG: DUF3408 domain-containing protein [Prevotellaceae bacterium]|jgi:hypothetical protein|nr:DUF3408 domain-containing protein [Prevotellaceae bacterium]
METNELMEITVDYESQFHTGGCAPPARFGKSVYIRREYHDRISQIVSVTGRNNVSIYEYIDNVLTHHFENFGDEITQSFKKNLIFK